MDRDTGRRRIYNPDRSLVNCVNKLGTEMYYLITYLVGIIIMLIVLMIRTPDISVNDAGIVCILWPIMIVCGIIILWLDSVDWDFDLQYSKKIFGKRKPNDGNHGFAITLFYVEFLFWKKRKV